MKKEQEKKLANEIARIIRREGMSYNEFNGVIKMSRK